MRIIVETQSRMRARLRTRARIAVVRALRTLAGVPVDREGAVTIRRISRFRKAVRSVVSDPLVRNRHAVALCGNCLRITVGTRAENETLLEALRKYKSA